MVDAKFTKHQLMKEQKLLNKKEAAIYLGISVRTVERMIAEGILKKIKIHRSVRVKLDEVMQIVEQGC